MNNSKLISITKKGRLSLTNSYRYRKIHYIVSDIENSEGMGLLLDIREV